MHLVTKQIDITQLQILAPKKAFELSLDSILVGGSTGSCVHLQSYKRVSVSRFATSFEALLPPAVPFNLSALEIFTFISCLILGSCTSPFGSK